MKFLCDVHISYRVVNYLISSGFRCIHVNEILDSWNTSDKGICAYADSEDYTVITKDSDFKDSFLIKDTPKKLIKINLGSISNNELTKIREMNIDAIVKLNYHSCFLLYSDKIRLSYIVK